jgi:uncharacterized protein (TIGR02246 family)
MKKLYLLASAAMIAFAAPAVYAKDAAPAATAAVEANAPAKVDVKKEVQDAFATWRTTLSGGKAEPIVALYAEDAVLLATLHNQPINNQKDRTEYFKGLTAKKDLKVKLDKEMVRVLDDATAAVSGTYTFSFEDAGKTVTVPARYSYVFEKIGGKWLIVEHHSSKFPMDK